MPMSTGPNITSPHSQVVIKVQLNCQFYYVDDALYYLSANKDDDDGYVLTGPSIPLLGIPFLLPFPFSFLCRQVAPLKSSLGIVVIAVSSRNGARGRKHILVYLKQIETQLVAIYCF